MLLPVALLVVGHALAATAAPAPQATARPSAHPAARTCPALFGDEAARARNEARRESVLILVWPGRVIDLVHRAAWGEPRPMRFSGLRLVEVPAPGGKPAAVVAIERPAAGCPAGRYELHVDDTLAGAAVLSIVDEVVILEYQGELRYLTRQDAARPVWRMTWQAPWRVRPPPRTSRPAGVAPPARRPPARPTYRNHSRR